MNDKNLRKIKIKDDICEIDEILNAQIFDRKRAEDVIRKHNRTDEIVAAINSPLRAGYVPFDQAFDDMIINNLYLIKQVLQTKLVKEQLNG